MKSPFGYCCINTELQKQKITTSRGMVKKTFEEKGLSYASELALLNLKDLYKILKWNVKNEIFNFRMSSELFPWMSAYELSSLPNFNEIQCLLIDIGYFVEFNNIRVTFHPGPYTVLASDNLDVVKKSIKEINQHAQIMDLMGLDKSPYYCINIHLNSTKPSKSEVIHRFINNFSLLSPSAQSRLTVENDDFENQYSVQDLMEVHLFTKIPIVFDQYHYHLGPKGYSMEESMHLAVSSWGKVKPLIHISSCRREEDPLSRVHAHSDYLFYTPDLFGYDVDVDLECKMKEQALFKFLLEKDNLPLISDMSVAKRILEMSKTDPKRKEYAEALGLVKIKEVIKPFSFKKGDYVKLKNGLEGKIISYASNKDIGIKFPLEENISKITKEDIEKVLN